MIITILLLRFLRFYAPLYSDEHDIDFLGGQACRNIQANYTSLHIRVFMQDARESSCEFRGKSCAMCSEKTPSRTGIYGHCRMVHEPSWMICPRLETALLMTENKFRQIEWKMKCLPLHSFRNTRQLEVRAKLTTMSGKSTRPGFV